MTRPVRFSSAELVRAIEAVQKAGETVAAARIKPDGTIEVLTGGGGAIPANDRNPLDRVLSR